MVDEYKSEQDEFGSVRSDVSPQDEQEAFPSPELAEPEADVEVSAAPSELEEAMDALTDVSVSDVVHEVPQDEPGTSSASDDTTPVEQPKPLGERLVDKGLISEDQLKVALQEQAQQTDNRQMLGAILVNMGFITESALGAVLTEASGIQYFDLKTAVVDANLISRVPKDVAIRHKMLPVSLQNGSVMLATADVYNILAIDQIHRYFPHEYKIVPVYSPETSIMEAIDQYYDYEMSIDGILKEIESGVAENKELSGEEEGYVNPTVRLVDALLIDAIKAGASDIHFEPESFFLRLRYRIDGRMVQVRSFHKDYWAAISVRIKIMSGMNIAETRAPQDGRINYNVLGREIDFRVATQPTIHGENIVMRILDKKKSLQPLDQLGYSDRNVAILKKMLKRPEGVIIITGPTGSGKTTTLYSVLNYINDIDVNIMTLEDPVEYQLPLIRQSQVREGTAMDFADGIKSLLRQDPDIIFLGEVRDEATANMAVRAAMTGHQVYTTLHTNDALGAIPRLVDIGIPPHMLSGSLICTIAQRLARRLCEHCKEEAYATEEECRILNADPAHAPTIYHAKGCEHCYNTGYKGRVAISEVMSIDNDFDELIALGATRKTMMDYALQNGFVPMLDDGAEKVLKGVTSMDELIRTVDVTSRV